jgi:hypothetical protein
MDDEDGWGQTVPSVWSFPATVNHHPPAHHPSILICLDGWMELENSGTQQKTVSGSLDIHPFIHPSFMARWWDAGSLWPFYSVLSFCEPVWAGYWERDPVMYNPVINLLSVKLFFAPINNLIAWYWIFKFLLPYWTWINNIGLLTNKLLKLFSQCISVILFYFLKNLQNMSMH